MAVDLLESFALGTSEDLERVSFSDDKTGSELDGSERVGDCVSQSDDVLSLDSKQVGRKSCCIKCCGDPR